MASFVLLTATYTDVVVCGCVLLAGVLPGSVFEVW